MELTRTNVDINCDLGEGITEQDCDRDRSLMKYISRCNIACGGHAGNKLSMNHSITNAAAAGLAIGAHPGYPDKAHFGRKTMKMKDNALLASIKSQINCLQTEADNQSVELSHIKFHGALYNDIESDQQLASMMADFCKHQFPHLKLLGLANGELQRACQSASVGFVTEGFMDRVYLSSGKLTPRSEAGSVISNSELAIKQALALTQKHSIRTSDNAIIKLQVDSICFHGDNPNATTIAQLLFDAFDRESIQITSKVKQ